jgi:hypothetical protein
VLFAGVVIWNPTHPATIIIGIVAVIAILAAARRRWVLRRSGPFVTAVLDRTGEVASIEQWPQKLGPKQRPSMIWIKTTANQQCMLALDTKQGENNAALVRALHERSPSATIVYPTLSTATAVR